MLGEEEGEESPRHDGTQPVCFTMKYDACYSDSDRAPPGPTVCRRRKKKRDSGRFVFRRREETRYTAIRSTLEPSSPKRKHRGHTGVTWRRPSPRAAPAAAPAAPDSAPAAPPAHSAQKDFGVAPPAARPATAGSSTCRSTCAAGGSRVPTARAAPRAAAAARAPPRAPCGSPSRHDVSRVLHACDRGLSFYVRCSPLRGTPSASSCARARRARARGCARGARPSWRRRRGHRRRRRAAWAERPGLLLLP
mmetsp:Transcript_10331/g.41831  ORF Transcript_10331/g.41831 Transcript_10331/m.41831 type:complete len:250 (-) Transcript_10331:109-858(-)